MQQRLGADIDGYLARTAHFAAALAASEGEVEEAQRLRYRVFADEFGARIPGSAQGLDRDDLDAFCHHLLVRERQSRMLVGTYRMLPAERARSAGGFYAEREFDLRGLRGLQPVTVEVGRACVHPDFRHGSVIALLWAALLRYLTASGSRHVMGCASVSLADGHAPAAATCGRLCEEHLGAERWRVFPRRPFPTRGWSRTLAVEPPPLVRGYLRLGAFVCGEPAWDEEFNTADLLMLLPLSRLDPRYARRLLRLGQRRRRLMTRGRPVPRSTRARRMARLVQHLAGLYASAVWRAPRLEPAGRRELAARFAREMLDDVLQVRLHVRGAPRERTPTLIVANHVSWLDMYVLNAVAGARFVAKSEVRGWPFFGTIATRFDTFFIVRGSYRDAARMRTAVARALGLGERVAVFPEGTTTDGTTVGRFFPALFQAAIDARARVQPVALRYRDAHGRPSAAPAFVGDTTVLASVRQVLREPALAVEATLGPSLDPAGRTRRELAEHTRSWIAATLGTGERASAERRAAA